MSDQEYSESGNPIYRYEPDKAKKFQPAVGNDSNIEAISNHIEKHVGTIESVFHELISDQVHIDIHWVKPSSKFPFHVLVTSGMSDQPMITPEEANDFRYSELCLLLPAYWKIGVENYKEIFSDEDNYWPLRWLKIIARFPHEYNTWVSYGHTIPNGEDAAPFAENTKMGCMMLLPSISLPEEFSELRINEDKKINFYCLYPLYKEEMNYKLSKGSDALLNKFEKNAISDVIYPDRLNTCGRKGLFGWW